MNKHIIGLCICGLTAISSVAHAGYASINSNTKPRFELTAGALYFQPGSSALDYAVLGFPFPVESPSWDVQSVRPSYTFGFDLGVKYYIPCTDLDVNLTWEHQNTSDSSSTIALPGDFVVFPFQAGPSFGQTLNNPSQQAYATVKFYYDVIDASVGKTINLNTNAKIRVFAGLSTAELKQHMSTTFADNAHTYSINSTNNSRFMGVGPLVGIDGNYAFANGIGLFGALSGSGLIGSMNASTKYASSSPELAAGGITVNYQSINPENSIQGIPGVNIKFGVNYFNPCISMFTASLGYEYATYFDAITIYNPTQVFGNVNTGAIALSSLGKTVSNFTVKGPFLNIGYKFL